MLKDVYRRIVRGLEHQLSDRYVEAFLRTRCLSYQRLSTMKCPKELATGFGPPRFYLGPGFRVQRAVAQDDTRRCVRELAGSPFIRKLQISITNPDILAGIPVEL